MKIGLEECMRPVVFSCLVFLISTAVWTQESQQPASEPEQQPTPQAVEPPPRVVGQAQTEEEAAAWSLVRQAATPEEGIRLTLQFLNSYPQSGLTPFGHYHLASIYRQMDDVDNFILHGEKALEELPDLPDVLGYLAFFYSEKGNNERAVQCAEKTIQLSNTFAKPPQMSDYEWAVRKAELIGEAHYALGRVNLSRATESQGEPDESNLAQAVTHFEQALDQTPEHPYAAFRLAEVHTRRQALDLAIQAYGMAAAMGGVIGEFAMSKLRTLYEHVHGNTDGINDVVNLQRERLQQKREERQRSLELLSRENEASESGEGLGAAEPGPAKPPL